MPKELLEQMKELRSQGMSYRAIAHKVGCGKDAVRRQLDPAVHEKELRRAARYRLENKAKVRESNTRYCARNKDKIKERDARYGVEHPEMIRAKRARHRALQAKATVGNPRAIAYVYDRAKNGARVRCYLCGGFIPKGKRHVDHVVPLAKGGSHTASNLGISCATCNLRKGAKLPEEVGVLL